MAATIRELAQIPKKEVLARLQRLGNAFEEWFVADGSESDRAPGLHPSEISKCLRKAVYGVHGTPRKGQPPSSWKWRFWHGHAIHDRMQATLAKFAATYTGSSDAVVEFEKELECSPEVSEAAAQWGIMGHADGLLTVYPHPGSPPALRVIVEIKSKSADEFEKMITSQAGPEEDHLDQATIYQACLDVPTAWILYFDKGSQTYTRPEPPFVVTFQHARWKTLQKRFAEIHELAAADTLPPRTEGIHCTFCSFRWTCNPEIVARKRRSHAPINLRWKPR